MGGYSIFSETLSTIFSKAFLSNPYSITNSRAFETASSDIAGIPIGAKVFTTFSALAQAVIKESVWDELSTALMKSIIF